MSIETDPSRASASRLAALPSGRFAKWVFIAAWAAIVVVAFSLFTKLGSVERDDLTSWLPTHAESTEVAALADRFPSGEVSTAVLVYSNTGGITQADRDKVAADREALASTAHGTIPKATPSSDGKAILLAVPLASGDTLHDSAKQVRTTATTDLPNGLTAHLTGPAGNTLDSSDAFAGADIILAMMAALVVAILLLIIYRSPVLWLLPLICAGVAVIVADAVIYLLGAHADLLVTSTNAQIIIVMVFGVGTDYALLLLSRYREELRRHEDHHHAMAVALRRSVPTILASGATVVLGLLCLLASEMNSNKGLGPAAAVGVACGLIVMLTLLPALLVVFGRWIFWPVIPRNGTETSPRRSVWAALSRKVGKRPRVVWAVTVVVLVGFAFAGLGISTGLDYAHSYTTKPDSVIGQQLLSEHFPAGLSRPVQIIANADAEDAVVSAVSDTPGVDRLLPDPEVSKDGTLVSVLAVLKAEPDSTAAQSAVERIRAAVHDVPDADAKVGGSVAINLDQAEAQAHDRWVVIPLVLVVVFLVLLLLLRSVVAPLLLIGTVVLSFFAALGISWLLFSQVLGFPAVDVSMVLLGFIFLVTLGVDYNIFLVSRMREEVHAHGIHEGVQRAMGATGGVITSAGVVVAGTFLVLASLPLVLLVELGLLIAIGILIDTFVVRSILVPALAFDTGRGFWWPGRLASTRRTHHLGRVDQVRSGSNGR
ncbi:MMPL family transporter [Paramicrobacterium chengjingii]|uniref:MMPL family transporter n=1 Tax=Paramicrobacterium chengjingii TaxID=2769067 RepID=UPI001423F20F|nr:MMPL family transporter [Microbacterium chengjingii]